MAGSVRVIDFKRNFNLRGATLIIRQVSYHELMKVTEMDVYRNV